MNNYQDMSEQEIWNELVNFFGNEYAAAGVMGNFLAESRGDSTNLEGKYESRIGMSDLEYTQAVDNGTYTNFANDHAGYGLGQWTATNRKQGLLDYANANNSSIGSTKLQIAYLEKELIDYEREKGYDMYSDLKKAGSVSDASDIMHVRYEMASSSGDSDAARARAQKSQKYYDKYAGTTNGSNGATTLYEQGLNGKISTGVSSGTSGTSSNPLAEETLEMDLDGINGVCASWVSGVSGIDLESVKVTQVFEPLTSCGIAVSYVPSLESALSKVTNLVSTVNGIITKVIEEQADIDDAGANKNSDSSLKKPSGTTGGSSGKGSSSGGSYSGGGSSGGSSSGSVSSNPSTSVNNSGANLGINSEMLNNINSLDFKSYNDLMTSLSSIVTDDVSLTTFLTNANYASVLKKTLLGSASMPGNLKEMMTNMDPKVLQATLYQMMIDTKAVDDFSENIMYTYVEALSKSTNKPIGDLLKNQDSLVKIFTDFNNISDNMDELLLSDNVNESLLKVYDGNAIGKMDSDNVDLLRVVVDKLAEEKNISSESLLTEESNRNYLNSSMESIGKSFKYISNVGYTDLDTASKVLTSLFK